MQGKHPAFGSAGKLSQDNDSTIAVMKIQKNTRKNIHAGSINGWNVVIGVWFRSFSFTKWVICRFHVNLPGCNG